MLVLTRRVGERIRIGENIVLTVTAIDGARVRIGIEAPRSLPILREELYRHGVENMQTHFPIRR